MTVLSGAGSGLHPFLFCTVPQVRALVLGANLGNTLPNFRRGQCRRDALHRRAGDGGLALDKSEGFVKA